MEMVRMNPPILLVEDNEANILVTTLFLEQLGYSCQVARNGDEALRMVDSGYFWLILMDVKMPGMDGFEVTGKIRELEKTQNRPRTPIIGLTAHAFVGDRQKCLSSGMDDYVSKPIHLEILEKKLDIIFTNVVARKPSLD